MRKDATNKFRVSPGMCIIPALRVLTYGKAFDEVDEMCNLSESLTRDSFYSSVEGNIIAIGGGYPQAPNK